MMKIFRFGIGNFIAIVLLSLAGCETIQSAPQLKISDGTITYVKVVPAPRPIGIGMPPVAMGAVGNAVNEKAKSQSERFADLVGNDRALILQNHLLTQVISHAREAGIVLVDANQIGNRSLKNNEQLITLEGFSALYMASTIMSGYQPSSMVIIGSSRDPVIPAGQHRYARVAQVNINDKRYSFTSSDGILEKSDLAMEGINSAVDVLAQRIAEQLVAENKSVN